MALLLISACDLANDCERNPNLACHAASNDGGSNGGGIPLAGNGAGAANTGGDAVGAGAMGGSEGIGGSGGEGGAPPEQTTVRAEDENGTPIIAYQVVVNGPDGGLLWEAVTGVDGSVDVPIPPGGSVSLVHAHTLSWLDPIQTYRAVDTVFFAGDPTATVRFVVNSASAPFEPPAGVMTLQLSYLQKAGAANYQIKTSCGQQTTFNTQPSLPLSSCTTDGLFDVLVVARNSGGDIIDYAHLDELPFAIGNVFHSMTWENASLDEIDFAISNIPTDALQITANTIASEEQGGRKINSTTQAFISEPGNQYDVSLAYPGSYGNEHCQLASIDMIAEPTAYGYMSKRRCSPTADLSTFAFDVSRLTRFDALPPSPDLLVLSWDQSWAGEPGDLLTIRQAWTRGADVGVWTAFLSSGAGPAVLPDLPPPLTAFAPSATDSWIQSSVLHEDYAGVDGFAETLAAGVPAMWATQTEGYTSHIY